jgi:hypothetical protein
MVRLFAALSAGETPAVPVYTQAVPPRLSDNGSVVRCAQCGRDARGPSVRVARFCEAEWQSCYVYGIIGRAGPVEFYQQAVGAIVIPDSDPVIHMGLLK